MTVGGDLPDLASKQEEVKRTDRPQTEIARSPTTMDADDIAVDACFLLECPEEVLVQICIELESLLAIYNLCATCHELRSQIRAARLLWRHRCLTLLSPSILLTHQAAWGGGTMADSARFYRRLYRAAVSADEFAYATDMQKSMLGAYEKPELEQHLAYTGHTATAVGPLVAVVGGMYKGERDGPIHVAVAQLGESARLVVPSLAEGSARPPNRLRHSACAVRRPSWATASAGCDIREDVLILGGYRDADEADEEGNQVVRRGACMLMALDGT